jgi:hypothetical protein
LKSSNGTPVANEFPGSTSSLGVPPPSTTPSSGVGHPPPMGRASSMPPPAVGSGPPTPASGTPGLAAKPPSRPATSMSNASDLDDILGLAGQGPPRSRAARQAAAKKKGRYVDVMRKES